MVRRGKVGEREGKLGNEKVGEVNEDWENECAGDGG